MNFVGLLHLIFMLCSFKLYQVFNHSVFQTNDPLMNMEDDLKLILNDAQSLRCNGVGW